MCSAHLAAHWRDVLFARPQRGARATLSARGSLCGAARGHGPSRSLRSGPGPRRLERRGVSPARGECGHRASEGRALPTDGHSASRSEGAPPRSDSCRSAAGRVSGVWGARAQRRDSARPQALVSRARARGHSRPGLTPICGRQSFRIVGCPSPREGPGTASDSGLEERGGTPTLDWCRSAVGRGSDRKSVV